MSLLLTVRAIPSYTKTFMTRMQIIKGYTHTEREKVVVV